MEWLGCGARPEKGVSATDIERVRVVGDRCVRNDNGTLQIDFQVIVELRLRRTTTDSRPCVVRVLMDGGFSHFELHAGGKPAAAVATRSGEAEYSFAIPPALFVDDETVLQLVKRTEGHSLQIFPPLQYVPPKVVTYAAVLKYFNVSPGYELVPHEANDKRKIEFVGDSDMAGFGNEGPATGIDWNGFLSVKVRHQNITNSCPHMLCRMLDAEPSVVAWSGIGVCQNADYCDPPGKVPTETCMQAVYERALGTVPKSKHDFETWQPDLVIVQVGANDLFGERGTPPSQLFVDKYVAMLQAIRQARPDAVILNVCSSLDTPTYISAGYEYEEPNNPIVQLLRESFAAYQKAAPDDSRMLLSIPASGQVWPEDGGCVEHWGTSGMLKHAEAVCLCIESDTSLGWKRVEGAKPFKNKL